MWQDQAACAGMDNFIDGRGTAQKKAVCSRCPVVNECLTFAMQNEDYEHTIYGGFTGTERKRLREGTVW